MASDGVAISRLATWVFAATEADWDALYREQLPRVYNFFRYRVGDGAVAEDLTSATFEKAWQSRYQYRRDLAKFTTWLLTIARNVAIDHYRARRPQAPLEAARDVPGDDSPERDVERRADLEQLGRLLQGLAERERELVALKYGAGLTNRAIAKLTGLSESNVGTILHRTIEELRSGWSD